MSFAQYNSGVSMGTGSSRDPLRVGMLFLGVLSAIILSIILVCFVWKAIEVLVEKYRRKSSSLPRRRQREPPDVEGQLEVRGGGRLALTRKKVMEVLMRMLPGSAAGCRRLNEDAVARMEGREQLCAPAAADAAAAGGDGTKSIIV